MRTAIILGILVSMLGCGASRPQETASDNQFALTAQPTTWPVAAQKLRTYCKSCHAVGSLRFIRSDSDQELWQFITNSRTPSGKVWAKAIVEVLDWPTNNAPPLNELKEPATGKDWMPKGSKRAQLASDGTGSQSARSLILKSLRSPAR